MTIRILVVDDHTIIRDGLTSLLNAAPGLEVVGEAGDDTTALLQLKRLRPDVVLLDISLGDASGLEIMCRMKAYLPTVRILILTVHEDKEMLQEALHNGASGYLPKYVQKSELINAIHAAMRSEITIHSSLTAMLFADKNHEDQSRVSIFDPLSRREIQVLRLLAKGNTNGQVGELLNISERTVEFHRKNILFKLNLNTRAELVEYAAEKGYL